ncbi:MAG: hypothetical protein JWO91_2647 [Acidobacteriaceae bacterium]|nr:hypothetical protein [Acidobacteriaceae bacterium]
MRPPIGRPQSEEAAPYYRNYIRQVSGDDPVAVMELQLGEFVAEFSGISEVKSLHCYAPEKWSVREVLNHVVDTERAFAFRALWFARGFETPLPSFDQNTAVSGSEADRIDWASHLEEFQHVRLAAISLFTHMPPAARMRSGIASDNRFTLRALAYIIAGHVAHHGTVLRTQYS